MMAALHRLVTVAIRRLRRQYCRLSLHRWAATSAARPVYWPGSPQMRTGPVRCLDCRAECQTVPDPTGRLLRERGRRDRNGPDNRPPVRPVVPERRSVKPPLTRR